jgi:hypothetical protein
MLMRKPLMYAAIAALSLFSVAPVQAQQHAPGASQKAAAPSAAKTPQSQAAPAAPSVDAQIADLRQHLKITSAQQAQFDALAAVIKQNDQDATANMPPPPSGPPTAVQSLTAAQTAAQTEADGLKKLLPPLQALYDTLSAEQKRTADQWFGDQDSGPEPQAPPKRR